jgi:regulator of RNase E activity RraA
MTAMHRLTGTPDSADLLPGPGFRICGGFQRIDPALVRRLSAFDTPTISDSLNRLYALDAGIQCLTAADRLCGFACTVHVYPGDNLMVHKVLDVAQPGDVVMINAHGGSAPAVNAALGDLICTKARHRGIAGFIVDGLIRDLPGILKLDMPVFARGTTAVGPLHRGPGEINFPIACGGVVTSPGDVVVADRAGAVVVPQSFVSELVERLTLRTDRSRAYHQAVARGEFSNGWVDALLGSSGCLIDGRPLTNGGPPAP